MKINNTNIDLRVLNTFYCPHIDVYEGSKYVRTFFISPENQLLDSKNYKKDRSYYTKDLHDYLTSIQQHNAFLTQLSKVSSVDTWFSVEEAIKNKPDLKGIMNGLKERETINVGEIIQKLSSDRLRTIHYFDGIQNIQPPKPKEKLPSADGLFKQKSTQGRWQ